MNKSKQPTKPEAKTGKYLYCPKCKEYPDNVVSEEKSFVFRDWNGDCYQGGRTEYAEGGAKYYCTECDTKLIDKS